MVGTKDNFVPKILAFFYIQLNVTSFWSKMDSYFWTMHTLIDYHINDIEYLFDYICRTIVTKPLKLC